MTRLRRPHGALWLLLALLCACREPPTHGASPTSPPAAPEPAQEPAQDASQAALVTPGDAPSLDAAPPADPEPEGCGEWPPLSTARIVMGLAASHVLRDSQRALARSVASLTDPEPAKRRRRRGTYTPPPIELDVADHRLFLSGVMTTGVRSRSALLWTRVLQRDARVRARYQAGPRCEPLITDWHPVEPSRDHTARVPLSDLSPGVHYRVEVEVEGANALSPTHQFATPPEDDAPIRVAFGADLHLGIDGFALVDDLVEARPDLYLSLGDWPYQDFSPVSRTLAAFRSKLALSRQHLAVRQWLRAMPVEAIWDDHEVLNDWDAAVARKAPDIVAAGTRAWREHFPTVGAPEGEIYRRFELGRGVEVFMLDGRSHRGEARPNGGTSMLGEAQLAWLLTGLEESTAAFKLVVTSVPLVNATTRGDAWDGHEIERTRLLSGLRDAGVEGVVFLTADQHWLAVHHLPEGFKEFQVGPLGVFTRAPRPGPPAWIRVQRPVWNFGLLDYDPGPPATLTFRGVGDDGAVLYEEAMAPGLGSLRIDAAPGMAWTLEGAHTFEGIGARVLPTAPEGDYRIHWRPLWTGAAPTEGVSQRLARGGEVVFANGARGPAPVLVEVFDGAQLNASRWRVVDQVKGRGGSRWRMASGALRESSKLKPSRASSVAGTYVETLSGGLFAEGRLEVRVLLGKRGELGVQYGANGDRFYRLTLGTRGAQLSRHKRGRARALGRAKGAVERGRWMTLVIERDGSTHRAWLDGRELFAIEDDALGEGAVGLFARGADDARFDELVVWPAD